MLSQMASCTYVLLFLFGKRPLVRITFGGYRWKTMKQVLLVGLSPFLIIASDSLLIIIMNMVISSYGGPERSGMLLTCNTIVQSFMLIITMPLGGITGGTQTVMGYNYGAGRADRIRKAEKHVLLLSVAFTTVMFISAQAGPGYFVRIFTREMSYVQVTEWAIRIFTLCIIPLAVEYTVVDGFTGMGIAKVAISLSMFRKSVYFLGMILLPRYFGVEAVFYSEPISDITACAAASRNVYPVKRKGAEG
ncbi:MAG: MATE family efflux transporter [Enterocloster clostridioformis]